MTRLFGAAIAAAAKQKSAIMRNKKASLSYFEIVSSFVFFYLFSAPPVNAAALPVTIRSFFVFPAHSLRHAAFGTLYLFYHRRRARGIKASSATAAAPVSQPPVPAPSPLQGSGSSGISTGVVSAMTTVFSVK